MADNPTVEYLHQRLRYEPETGKLFWREYAPNGPAWNGRCAGMEAFTADNGQGYKVGTIDRRRYKAARVIWALAHGYWPNEVDHEDHDRSSNRLGNLREVTRLDNNRNASQRHDNTSGVTGVYWAADRGRWRAQIKVDSRMVHLGSFADFADAVAARKTAELEYGYHANHGTRLQEAA